MAPSTSRSTYRSPKRLGVGLLLLGTLLLPAFPRVASAEPAAITVSGRPKVTLDRLTLPEVPGRDRYRKSLEIILRREARHANWGVGRGSKISYRFEVTELRLVQDGNVLRVSCSAVGRLPGNHSARSRLEFGGDPKHPDKLVEEVLRIVARGVVTRLAELERIRRGLH